MFACEGVPATAYNLNAVRTISDEPFHTKHIKQLLDLFDVYQEISITALNIPQQYFQILKSCYQNKHLRTTILPSPGYHLQSLQNTINAHLLPNGVIIRSPVINPMTAIKVIIHHPTLVFSGW